MQQEIDTPEFMTRDELADWLGVSKRWLDQNAHTGPPYYKLSKTMIRYRVSEVETWLQVRRSTRG